MRGSRGCHQGIRGWVCWRAVTGLHQGTTANEAGLGGGCLHCEEGSLDPSRPHLFSKLASTYEAQGVGGLPTRCGK